MTNTIRATQGVKALADQQRQLRKAESPSVIRLQVSYRTRLGALRFRGNRQILRVYVADMTSGFFPKEADVINTMFT